MPLQDVSAGKSTYRWLSKIAKSGPDWFLGSIQNRNHFEAWMIYHAAIEVTTLPREQVYVLQKRNSQGYFVQVARFNKPVSIEYVKKEFGDGYYILRSCIPRFSTIWKGWAGEPKSKNDLPARQTREIRSLKDTTDNLALGEIVLGVGEVLGFAL